jgi:hypothetical protein
MTYSILRLLEAQDYLGMFNDFIKSNPNSRTTIDRYVKWARTTLKKNDRIVWFLRFARIELAGQLRAANSDAELDRLNKKIGTNYSHYDLIPLNNLMTTLAHYLAMPIPAIQAVVWAKQSPRELTAEFDGMEEQYRQTADDDTDAAAMARQSRLIPRDKGDQIIIRCPDGMVWVDLEKAGCSIEGRAMGHCGNGTGNYGETVFSLRKPVIYQGEGYWYPVATFIRDRNNMLGEMKGRGNKKPASRYHNDIVLLLKSDYVDGIKGGGYLPQENFSLDDLDPDVKDELIEEKPSLGGLEYTYRKEGMTGRVQEMVDAGLETSGISPPDAYVPGDAKGAGHFVLQEWSSFDRFLGDLGDTNLESLYDIATGQDDEADHDPQIMFVTMVTEHLPPAWRRMALQRAGMPPNGDPHRAAEIMIKNDDEWFQTYEYLLRDKEARRETAWERVVDYAKNGWPFACYAVYTNMPRDENKIRAFLESDQPIQLLIGERELVEIASGDDEDSEYNPYQIAREGWSQLDVYHDNEHLRDTGLLNDDGQDEWLASDGGGGDYTEQFIQAISGERDTRIDDPRQQEFKLESMQRLRQLAGLAHIY